MTATRSISIGLFVAVLTFDGVAQPAGRPLPEGAVAHRDLAYVSNGHERQKLDLYLPQNGSNLPLIVNIHGGANGFSHRANRCLFRAGIPAEKSAVVHALNSGALQPGKRPLSYGRQTHLEICRWAGVDVQGLRSKS